MSIIQCVLDSNNSNKETSMKTCRQCSKEYPATKEFFNSNGKYLRNVCKKCQSQAAKKYNDGRYLERYKKYNKANRERQREWHKQHYKDNRERLLKQTREYYYANVDVVKERIKKYNEKNADWYREYKREWARKNRLQQNIRRGIYGCLSGKQKKSKSLEYLGCSVEELWSHLESQFQEGMTRENYGEWHLDHIRPLSSWDFEIETECKLREAWHYTNLQPLWAKDNLSKGKSWKKTNK